MLFLCRKSSRSLLSKSPAGPRWRTRNKNRGIFPIYASYSYSRYCYWTLLGGTILNCPSTSTNLQPALLPCARLLCGREGEQREGRSPYFIKWGLKETPSKRVAVRGAGWTGLENGCENDSWGRTQIEMSSWGRRCPLGYCSSGLNTFRRGGDLSGRRFW